jgi:hypothetical protein
VSGALAVAALVALPMLCGASGGNSGSCDPGGGAQTGYFSVACVTGGTQTADEVRFNNAGLYNDHWSSGDHINESLWAFSGSSCQDSVEVGLTYGFGGGAYFGWYYADTTSSGQYARFISNQASDASEHSYALVYDGQSANGGEYSVYIDGADYANLGNIGLGNGTCQSMVGLEETTAPDSGYFADTFNDTPIYSRDNSGNWSRDWGSYSWYISDPCGTFGNTPPACFYGASYSSSSWSNSKLLPGALEG